MILGAELLWGQAQARDDLSRKIPRVAVSVRVEDNLGNQSVLQSQKKFDMLYPGTSAGTLTTVAD